MNRGAKRVPSAFTRQALKLQSDVRLAELAQSGVPEALETLFDRYRAPLVGFTGRLVGPDRAEDIVQQTFVKAMACADEGAIGPHPKPWLYRVAHNLAIDELRRKANDNVQMPTDEHSLSHAGDTGRSQVDETVASRERLRELVADIGNLPESQRAVLILRELEGRSVEDIALALDLSHTNVYQLLHRARKRLRDGVGALIPLFLLRALFSDRASAFAAGSQRMAEVASTGGTSAAVKTCVAVCGVAAVSVGIGVGVSDRGHRASTGQASGGTPESGFVADVARRQPHHRSAAQKRRHRRAKRAHDDLLPGSGGNTGSQNGSGGSHRDSHQGSHKQDRPSANTTTTPTGGGQGGSGSSHSATVAAVDSSGTLEVTGGSGEANRIAIDRSSGAITVADGNGIPVAVGSGCSQVSTALASCDVSAIKALSVNSGDRDDQVTVGNLGSVGVTVYGGEGEDQLSADTINQVLNGASLLGEAGDDRLTGGRGSDVLGGGAGDDRLDSGANYDRLLGGDGDDVMDGGSEMDMLTGQNGADVLHGGSDNDQLFGGSGSDRMFGEGGDDNLNAIDSASDSGIDCGDGQDDVAMDESLDAAAADCDTVN